jgi:hypothetical protein
LLPKPSPFDGRDGFEPFHLDVGHLYPGSFLNAQGHLHLAVFLDYFRGDAGVVKSLGAVKNLDLLKVRFQGLFFKTGRRRQGAREGSGMVIWLLILRALMVFAPSMEKDLKVREAAIRGGGRPGGPDHP